MRWKNGGGETRELAVHPPGAPLENFDWRVSMARVATDGPFSAFPDVDRTLTILDGDGLDLAVGLAAPVRLTPASGPHVFPADAPSVAKLLGRPVDDLNVMTRRGRFTHAVNGLDLDGPVRIEARDGTLILFCRDGEIAAGGAVLGPRDALLLSGDESREVRPRGAAARALAIAIRPA